ncbi:hypothetical protein H8356DRAFT_1706270 [Neocallimastix lanati (nom. inval.)]|nr:hypothetical protein H8356DRAFT_1706270 [Neocallimastix sp. JGI-2020a]
MSELSPKLIRIIIICTTIILIWMVREVYLGYLIELKRFQSSTLLQGDMATRWILNEDKLKWFKRNEKSEYFNVLHLGCGTGDKQLSYRPPLEAYKFYKKHLSKYAGDKQMRLLVFSDNERFAINRNCGFQWHNLTIKDNIPEPTFHYHSIPIQFLPTKELEGIHSVDMVIDSLSYSSPNVHIPRNINLFSNVLPSGGIYFIARSNILNNKIKLNDTTRVDNQLESIKYIKKYRFKKCFKMGCIWKLN